MKHKKVGRKHLSWIRRIGPLVLIVVVLASSLTFLVDTGHAAADIAFISQNTNSATTAATSVTVTAPTGTAAGNLLIAEVFALPGTSNATTITAPSGWTKIGVTVTANKYSLACYYHVVTASEPANYTFSFSPASTAMVGIGAFSGADTKSPVDVSAGQSNTSSTSQTAPSVTTTYNTDAVLPIWAYEAGTTSTGVSAGLTNFWNTSAGAEGITGSYKVLTNSGSTGTFTSTTGIATASLAMTIGLKPAAASAGVQYVATQAPSSCATCSSIVATLPALRKAGDFMITSVAWNTNTSTLTAPSGWTQIDSNISTGAFSQADFYHFVATGDPSTYTWTFSANTALAMISTIDFQGVDSAQPIDVSATAVSASGTSDAAPSLTTNFAQDMLFDIWSWNTGTTASSITSTMTKIWDAQTGNASANDSTAAGYELQGLAGATGTRTVVSGRTAIAMMHSIALKPYLPTPSLISPSSGSTLSLSPTFQLVNASLTNTPQKYKIQLCSTSNCSSIITTYDQTVSQTGWTGQDANAGTAYVGNTDPSLSTSATYTVQTPLTACTQYYWRGLSYDTYTLQLSNPSNINSFVTNCLPSAPSLFSPPAGASNVPLHPEFRLASTDADSDYLRYKIELCSTSNCSSIIATFNQTSSQSGWSGQDQNSSTAYGSDPTTASNSTIAYYNYNSGILAQNTQYWWRAYAIDPAGTNTLSAASAIQAFTTNLTETRIVNGSILKATVL